MAEEIISLIKSNNIYAIKILLENSLIAENIILDKIQEFYDSNRPHYTNEKSTMMLIDLLNGLINPKLATSFLKSLLGVDWNNRNNWFPYLSKLFDYGASLTINDYKIGFLPEKFLFDIIGDEQLNIHLAYEMLCNEFENVFNYAIEYITSNNLINNERIVLIMDDICCYYAFYEFSISTRILFLFNFLDDKYYIDYVLYMCLHNSCYKNIKIFELLPEDYTMSKKISLHLMTVKNINIAKKYIHPDIDITIEYKCDVMNICYNFGSYNEFMQS